MLRKIDIANCCFQVHRFIPKIIRQDKLNCFTVYCHKVFDFACRWAVIQISNRERAKKTTHKPLHEIGEALVIRALDGWGSKCYAYCIEI